MSLSRNATFAAVVELLIKDAETQVALKARSPSILRDYRQRYRRYCELPLGKRRVREVTHRTLKELVADMAAEGIKSGTILTVMSFISRVLSLAVDEGVIENAPAIPRPKQQDSPRSAFSRTQYRHLLDTCRKAEAGDIEVRWKTVKLDTDFRALITFAVNSFFRPGDLFALQHKQVEIVERRDTKYLKLTPPASKRHAKPIISMPAAVDVYKRLLARQKASGRGEPEDYVFFPERPNRDYAKEIGRRLFGRLLEAADLKTNARGEPYTLYSLRHTAIMLRLVNADGLDLLTLARNCRTSVEMIDRFYASELTAEMNVDVLHSFRRSSRYREADFRAQT